MSNVLMPKATAVWLIEETALSFEQIAAFCELHPLEVQGIANEEVSKGMRGVDPIAAGFLSRAEIDRAEADPEYRLRPQEARKLDLPEKKRKKARFTPTTRRGNRPDAIAWFLRNHPEVPDSQIVALIGTTKATIEQVRSRSHWNIQNIKPVDPVSLSLCSQIELDAMITKAAQQKAKDDARLRRNEAGPTLRPASETVPDEVYDRAPSPAPAPAAVGYGPDRLGTTVPVDAAAFAEPEDEEDDLHPLDDLDDDEDI